MTTTFVFGEHDEHARALDLVLEGLIKTEIKLTIQRAVMVQTDDPAVQQLLRALGVQALDLSPQKGEKKDRKAAQPLGIPVADKKCPVCGRLVTSRGWVEASGKCKICHMAAVKLLMAADDAEAATWPADSTQPEAPAAKRAKKPLYPVEDDGGGLALDVRRPAVEPEAVEAVVQMGGRRGRPRKL